MSKFIPNSFQHPNAYVDEYMPLLTGNEYKVLTYAIRRIIGFQKTDDRISISQFADGIKSRDGQRLDGGTGLGEGAVRAALKELIKYKLIVVVAQSNSQLNLPPLFTLQWNSDYVDKEGLERRMNDKKTLDAGKADKARVGLPPRSNGRTGSNGQTTPGLTVNTTPGLTDRGHIVSVEIQGNPDAPNGAAPIEEKPVSKKGDLVDGFLFYANKNNGQADLSFLGEHLRPLAMAFIEVVGKQYAPQKSDYSFWRKTLNDWYARGFTPQQVSSGTKTHLDAKLSVKSPASVTYAILETESKVYTYLEAA